MSIGKVTRIAILFLVLGLLMHFASHLSSNYYVNMDKDGNEFNCTSLINDFESGNTSEFSKLYGSSIFKNKSRTVASFEIDNDFSFMNCKEEIDNQHSSWCEIKETEITARNFDLKIEELEKYCDFTQSDFTSNFENETFEIIEGKNTLLKFGNKSKPVSGMTLWDPFKAHSPENGLYKVCIVDKFANCGYFKSKSDAEKEHERLLKYLVKG